MSAFADPSVRSIIFENIETTRNFGSFFLHAAELSHVKSALNLLAAAKQSKNQPLADAMRRRIDERKKTLLKAPDVPLAEKCKLLIRCAAPVLSLKLFNRLAK